MLLFFLPICLLYVFLFLCFFVCFCFCLLFFVVVFLFCFLFLLENKCKFAAYYWLQISCINKLLLINSSLLLLFLFATSYNLQTLNVLCSFIIIVGLIMNVESFVFLYVFHLAFPVFLVCFFVWFLILIMFGWLSYPSVMFLTALKSSNRLLVFPVVLGGIRDEFSTLLM